MHKPYDLIADQWHTNKRAPGYIEHVLSYVDRILEDLPTGARVLDLGCGTGEPVAKHIVERGLSVTGIDESSEMLKFARQTVPEAELIHADMVNVELTDTLDAAVAWDSMFHVERKHHAAIYRKLRMLCATAQGSCCQLVGQPRRKTIRSKASPLKCTVRRFTTAASPRKSRAN